MIFCFSYMECTGYQGDLRHLESVQRRWTKNIDDMEELSSADRLMALNMYSIKGRLLRADLLKCCKIFNEKCGNQPSDLFLMASDIGTRGHRFNLAFTHSSLECRRQFFALRYVYSWNALPDELVSLDSVDAFKRGAWCFGPQAFRVCGLIVYLVLSIYDVDNIKFCKAPNSNSVPKVLGTGMLQRYDSSISSHGTIYIFFLMFTTWNMGVAISVKTKVSVFFVFLLILRK